MKYNKLNKYCGEIIKISATKDLTIATLKEQRLLNNNQPSVKRNVDLSAYNQLFSDEQLQELQDISQNKGGDMSFVRKIVFNLYGECDIQDIPAMKTRFKNSFSQKPLPDDIRKLIKSMLSVRLEAITETQYDYLFRLNNVPLHISQALYGLIKANSE